MRYIPIFRIIDDIYVSIQFYGFANVIITGYSNRRVTFNYWFNIAYIVYKRLDILLLIKCLNIRMIIK